MQPLSDPLAAKFEGPASRYMFAGGTRIHYQVEGRGPTLLLLHGVLASLHTWDGWVERLSSHYRLVRIDLPGFGLSDHLPSDDYTPEHAVELIEQVRANLHLESFHVAGNSLGGFFAWYYAAHHPDRVNKLILLDPIGYPQKLPPIVSFISLPLVGELARLMAPRFLVEQGVRMVYGDPNAIRDGVVDRYHQLLLRGRNRLAMVRTCRRLRAYRNDFELCRRIPRVRAPTLLMWGERDRWVPPSLIDAWRRDLPTAQVKVYPGVGHIPMEELPELTAQDAHAFLSQDEERDWSEGGATRAKAVPYVSTRGAQP